MARINNLTNFLTDIATAIKSKTGRNTNITPSNFDTEILSIASDLGSKNISISSNGTSTYQASNDNLDGYSSVAITTNVQPTLQSKTISPTTSSQTISADNNYDGLSQVTINAVTNLIDSNITAGNIKKDVSILGVTGTYDNSSDLGTKTITSNGTYNASSDNVDGYSSVTVNVPSSGSLPTITDARYLFACDRVNLYDELLAMCSGITSTSYMFYDSGNVANLDLSKLNRFNITDMSYMFAYAGFRSLDFSNLDTSNVTNMVNIFANSRFQNIDLRGVDMSNVTTLESMCYWCSSLKTLNLSGCNTSNVTRIYHMLYYCRNLEELDISNFDFTNVTYYSGAFTNCGTNNDTPTTVYVKDATAQQWILNLSSSDRPSDWSTDNVIIKGS